MFQEFWGHFLKFRIFGKMRKIQCFWIVCWSDSFLSCLSLMFQEFRGHFLKFRIFWKKSCERSRLYKEIEWTMRIFMDISKNRMKTDAIIWVLDNFKGKVLLGKPWPNKQTTNLLTAVGIAASPVWPTSCASWHLLTELLNLSLDWAALTQHFLQLNQVKV